jgi:hypothetical protein
MEIVRKKNIRRKGNRLVIDLPPSFEATEVDVLVFPSHVQANEQMQPENMSDFLSQLPDMSDEVLKEIDEKRKHLQGWI